jgi:hypothetical protein
MRAIRVTMDDVPIPASWEDGAEQFALAKLSIKWGRDDLYGEPDPSKLTLRVMDLTGEWSTAPERTGATIIVYQDERKVFRGEVDIITSKPARFPHPESHDLVDGWITTFSAVDPMAAMDKYVPLGPGVRPGSNNSQVIVAREYYGPDHWPEAWGYDRIDDLKADAGVTSIVPNISTGFIQKPDWETAGTLPTLWFQSKPFGESALTLIRQIYSLPGPSHTNYDPERHYLYRGQLAEASPLKLAFTAGMLTLAGGDTTEVVPGGAFSIPERAPVESTFSRAISQIRLHGQRGVATATSVSGITSGSAKWDNPYEMVRAVPNLATRSRNALDINTDCALWLNDAIYYGGERAARHVADVASRVSKINGRIGLPDLGLDLRREQVAAGLTEAQLDVLLDVRDYPVSFYFTGFIYAGLKYVGPMFQLIGATLCYDGGWYVEGMKFVPMAYDDATGIRFDNWLPNANPTFEQVDPDITFSDLGLVTQGA